MKRISTFIIALFFAALATAQVNPGFFEIRAVDNGSPNQVNIEMRAINSVEPTTSDFVTDLIFGTKFIDPSVINVELNCLFGNPCLLYNTMYNITEASGILTHAGTNEEYIAWNASNTPFSFPEDWPLNQWIVIAVMDITTSVPPSSQSSSSAASLIAITDFGFESGSGNSTQTGPNIGVNLTDYTPAVGSVLPLDLLDFEAEKRGERSTILTWETANEVNTSHFVVERSSDIQNWEQIGTVQAAGTSLTPLRYTFLDEDVYDGRRPNARYYYRLRMVDRDDRFKFSRIDLVLFSSDGESGNSKVYVFPNPSTDGLNIQFDVDGDGALASEISVINTLGQMVYHREVPEGTEMEYIDYSKTNITTGSYVLRVIDADNNIIDQIKVVVQDN